MNLLKLLSPLLIIFIHMISNDALAFSSNAVNEADKRSYYRNVRHSTRGDHHPQYTPQRQAQRKTVRTSTASGAPFTLPGGIGVGGPATCGNPTTTDKCLMCTCGNEAGNLDLNGKINVIRTVIARVNSALYPNTACGVVRQKKHFSWFNGYYGLSSRDGRAIGRRSRAAHDHRRSVTGHKAQQCSQAISQALKAGSNGACNYHANYVRPRWARGKRVAFRDRVHIYYGGTCGRRGRSGGGTGTPMRVHSSIQFDRIKPNILVVSLYEGA